MRVPKWLRAFFGDTFLYNRHTPLTARLFRRYPYQVVVEAYDRIRDRPVQIAAYSKGGNYLLDTLRGYLSTYPGCCIRVYRIGRLEIEECAGDFTKLKPCRPPLVAVLGKLAGSRYAPAPRRNAEAVIPISLLGFELHKDVVAQTYLLDTVAELCPELPL